MDQKFSFSWSNLTAWYMEKQEGKNVKKYILDQVSGTVFSNSLIAIMGVSGAGKTTFLASIAGKNNDKSGMILLNNSLLEDNYLNGISNYVYQNDIMVQNLTTMEHMKFMAHFKLKDSRKESLIAIETVLNDLNLETCKDTFLKDLSGGERKRVSLAGELLNDPLILFCDEPTTGLDSSNAVVIVEKLRNRAMMEKLVMVTIHQPSSQLFELFTHVILIANGDIFYCGTREGMAQYFDRLKLHCPKNFNPGEFYIKCISTATNNHNAIKTFHTNKLFMKDECYNEKLLGYNYNQTNFYASVYHLLWRTYLDTKRNFRYHVIQAFFLLISASILASFYSLAENGESVQNTRGILYFFTSELIFTHTYNVVNTFPGEYCIFLREKALYSVQSYFISKIFAIVPRNIIQPLLFLIINFTCVKFLSGFVMFIQVYVVSICACMCGSMIGLLISAIFTSMEYMDLFVAPFELMTMIAAGLLINLESSLFFKLVKYTSPFYYTYESLSIIHWSNVENIVCNNASAICYQNGKEVLEELGFNTDLIYVFWNMVYMGILSIFIGLVTFSVILYRRNKHCSY